MENKIPQVESEVNVHGVFSQGIEIEEAINDGFDIDQECLLKDVNLVYLNTIDLSSAFN